METQGLLDALLAQTSGLGAKLGVLLAQLPPSLLFDAQAAERFFTALRERYPGPVACEPRHASWFAPEAEALLNEVQVARIAADPAIVPAAAVPGGWKGLVYYRLHGSPRMYYSAYTERTLAQIALELRSRAETGAKAWCIFDNTAAGCAMTDALTILSELRKPSSRWP